MKILILTSRFGMGHFSAAKAIEQKLHSILNDRDELKIVDIFEYSYGDFSQFIYKSYQTFIHKGAPLYNLAYKKATRGNHQSITLRKIYRKLKQEMTQLFLQEQADIVISTYSVASMLASDCKKELESDFLLITAITDVSPHDSWINEATDHYLVADEQGRDYLCRMQVPAEIITISGMPVAKSFEQHLHKRNTKSPDQKEKRLLVMGGGLGLLPHSTAFYRALNDLKDVKTTVITAKNEKLYKKLAGRFEQIEVLGYCEEMANLMEKADLLLTKSGGLTTFEAICSKTPLMIFKPFLEQEVTNARLVSEKGIGIVLEQGPEQAEEAINEIERLLRDFHAQLKMREQMAQLCKGWQKDAIIDLVQAHRTASA
ncbi:MAG: glycosyltransferase [Peptostreptococcaceae bacterium]|nr:glycosyltransferase [Peptostreptococcaceae bacterium]